MQLGINVNDISYFGSNKPFSNLVKGANRWDITDIPYVSVRSNILSTTRPFVFGGTLSADVSKYLKDNNFSFEVISGNQPKLPVANNLSQGNYQVSFQGNAILSYKRKPVFNGGMISVDEKDNIDLRVLFLNGSISEIKVVKEENLNSKFNPIWLEKIQSFKTIRFMDWGHTNNSTLKSWRDRTTTSSQSYFNVDVPIEEICELCNLLKVNPWVNIPHLADNNYVKNTAEAINQFLSPDLKVYIEYSNEVWNSSFKQNEYASEETKINEGRVSDYYVKQASQVIKIAKKILGDKAIGVLGSQFANVGWAKNCSQLNQFPRPMRYDSTLKDVGFDVLAVGAYFGYRLGNKKFVEPLLKMTTDELIEAIFKQIFEGGIIAPKSELTLFEDLLIKNVETSQAIGLPLVAYESGQHLVGNTPALKGNIILSESFIAANRDERMGQAYQKMLDLWQQYNGDNLFCLFNDVKESNRFGSWGIWENLQDDSYKGNIVKSFLI